MQEECEGGRQAHFTPPPLHAAPFPRRICLPTLHSAPLSQRTVPRTHGIPPPAAPSLRSFSETQRHTVHSPPLRPPRSSPEAQDPVGTGATHQYLAQLLNGAPSPASHLPPHNHQMPPQVQRYGLEAAALHHSHRPADERRQQHDWAPLPLEHEHQHQQHWRCPSASTPLRWQQPPATASNAAVTMSPPAIGSFQWHLKQQLRTAAPVELSDAPQWR